MTDYTIQRSTSPDQQTASELITDGYLIHRRDTICLRCKHTATSSEIFEVQVHPTRKSIRRLTPATSLKPGYKTGLSTLQVRYQPACFMCFDSLPQDVKGDNFLNEDAWRETLKKKYAPAPSEPKTEPKERAKPSVSLEDL